jgi:hypothetical protein
MEKRLKYIIRFSKVLLVFVVVILTTLWLDNYTFTNQCVATNTSDYITIHFIHGSVPKAGCIDQRKRIGGKLGGHVEIEIDTIIYGFEILNNDYGVNVFPKNKAESYNSHFTKKLKSQWYKETINDKITSIQIPVTIDQKDKIRSLYEQNLKICPYDYAFFGMRCASSAYKMLCESNILKKRCNFIYVLSAFTPRQFRNKMIKLAYKHNFRLTFKEGIDCRDWD